MKEWFIKFCSKPGVQLIVTLLLISALGYMLWVFYNIFSLIWWLYNLVPAK
jgi:hypothetical protein